MTTDIDLETKVIKRFIIKSKRDRYLTFIQRDKTRAKFLNDLSHSDLFQEDLFDIIKGNETETIKKRIREVGNIKDCYIISENKAIDRKRLDIETALNQAVSIWSDTGTLIVFGDAEIIYREAEGLNNRWISKPIKFK